MQTAGRTLTLEDLTADAPGSDPLGTALEGFLSGRERTFSAHTGKLRSVMLRTLAFTSNDSADEYLGWLEAHVDVFIGRAEPAGSLPLPGAPILHRQLPCGCSPKEVPSHLVTWRRDEMVLLVIVTGPESGTAAMSFAEKLDALVEAPARR